MNDVCMDYVPKVVRTFSNEFEIEVVLHAVQRSFGDLAIGYLRDLGRSTIMIRLTMV